MSKKFKIEKDAYEGRFLVKLTLNYYDNKVGWLSKTKNGLEWMSTTNTAVEFDCGEEAMTRGIEVLVPIIRRNGITEKELLRCVFNGVKLEVVDLVTMGTYQRMHTKNRYLDEMYE